MTILRMPVWCSAGLLAEVKSEVGGQRTVAVQDTKPIPPENLKTWNSEKLNSCETAALDGGTNPVG